MDKNTKYTNYPVCPWCGRRAIECLDIFGAAHDGYECTLDCDECGRSFDAVMHVTVEFSTKKATP
jgi:transcription elongation factor Elf1